MNIIVEHLQMDAKRKNNIFIKELMIGEIDDLKVEHYAILGATQKEIHLESGYISMFIFLQGEGRFTSKNITKQVVPESIAIPMNDNGMVQLEVTNGTELQFLKFTKKLSQKDIEDFKNFPIENKYSGLFFTLFEDCAPYTEKIKSPNTVSRTVLPANIIPRISLGTVEALGPDEVGAHKHPMLEQLFIGLSGNEIKVYADGISAQLPAFSLLHIPLGSNHWVKVDENKKMNYMWMDFFLTKEGEEWLKTHKPINADSKV